ncbi:efflux RND transporter periplasmic adaptor subunit [Pelobacter propionicus]|uniref:Efflux transporter, RND family, MFP subunit n=1 Tax=Pelobacter propionicus (strain DSM 2379 / NBRC 103807 / OttBd1) TaxID=338966 RepID=A1AKU5_PELPD|nr:efflux RND transporter periplasmic adaptor subunit [Pelobacter propionicus]ABK97965.1 efflux transporter, RND family, MFP subunit [Pelobacter propionicus DSM 2379]
MHVTQTIKRATLLAGIAGVLMLNGCGNKQSGATPPPAPPVVGVVIIKPQRVELTTELAGRTAAYLVAEVRPQVNGIVQKRLFTEGSDVKAGQVLYQIDPSTYRAAHASARASLSRAEATLVSARLKAKRYGELVKINAVSQQDHDDAYAALKQAEADVESSKAAVESARINLAYTRVTAPISGRIGRSLITTGALMTANQATALATIQQLSPVYVDITQTSAELLRLKHALASGQMKGGGQGGTKVKLLLEDGSTYPHEGVLKFSDVTVDQSTGSVTLRSVFANPKQLLLPGMYVRAVIQEGVNENAILAPQKGVTRNSAGNPTALVVGANNKVESRLLTVSRTIGDSWLVNEGLKAGDRLIVEGTQKAKPGSSVKPVAYTPRTGAATATAAAH